MNPDCVLTNIRSTLLCSYELIYARMHDNTLSLADAENRLRGIAIGLTAAGTHASTPRERMARP